MSLSDRNLRAIILGGGPGWDESGFAAVRPYPLMPVAHSPLVCHTLLWLARHGIGKITVCTNEAWRLGRSLLARAASTSEDVTYFIDAAPRGTAGCVRDAAEQFGGERFLVCDGTILPDMDLVPLLRHHDHSGAGLTVVVTGERVQRDGVAQRLSPVGVYILDRAILAEVPEKGFQDLKEMLLPKLYARNIKVTTYLAPRACPRVIGLNSYLALCAAAALRLAAQSNPWPGYRRHEDSFIHESARVENPEHLVGPVLVGAETHIASDVSIIGPATIGARCTIESQAVICSSVLWDLCRVGRRAVVDHAVLADGARLTGGRRIDHTLLPGDPDAAVPARVDCAAARAQPGKVTRAQAEVPA